MRGKIDKTGALWLERNNRMMRQYCPFTKPSVGFPEGFTCGFSCPLFIGPVREGQKDIIYFCNREGLYVEDFIIEEISL